MRAPIPATLAALYEDKAARDARRERLCAVAYWIAAGALFPALFLIASGR